ncbi:hypothetical protein ACFL3V_05725 [Nanoarchaeota archaeon]
MRCLPLQSRDSSRDIGDLEAELKGIEAGARAACNRMSVRTQYFIKSFDEFFKGSGIEGVLQSCLSVTPFSEVSPSIGYLEIVQYEPASEEYREQIRNGELITPFHDDVMNRMIDMYSDVLNQFKQYSFAPLRKKQEAVYEELKGLTSVEKVSKGVTSPKKALFISVPGVSKLLLARVGEGFNGQAYQGIDDLVTTSIPNMPGNTRWMKAQLQKVGETGDCSVYLARSPSGMVKDADLVQYALDNI